MNIVESGSFFFKLIHRNTILSYTVLNPQLGPAITNVTYRGFRTFVALHIWCTVTVFMQAALSFNAFKNSYSFVWGLYKTLHVKALLVQLLSLAKPLCSKTLKTDLQTCPDYFTTIIQQRSTKTFLNFMVWFLCWRAVHTHVCFPRLYVCPIQIS